MMVGGQGATRQDKTGHDETKDKARQGRTTRQDNKEGRTRQHKTAHTHTSAQVSPRQHKTRPEQRGKLPTIGQQNTTKSERKGDH